MTLDFILGIQALIVAFLSYVITITFAGWFESWMAKKMGDDTPEQLGFLTLNPLEHFNVFGFAAVLWGQFYARLLPFQLIPGWGRYIPLLPDTMRGKNLQLRGFVEFMGRAIAHFILLMTTLIVFSVFYKYHLMTPLQAPTSFLEVVRILLLSLFNQNFMLFIVHVIIGIFKYFMHFHVPRLDSISWERILLFSIVLSLGIFILEPVLRKFIYFLSVLIHWIIFNIGW